MDAVVPITRKVDDLYGAEDLEAQKPRWNQLKQRFSELYEEKAPDFVARSPGRVNIIGEHIDYSLYEVLPMAIASDVLVAVSVSNPGGTDIAKVFIANVDSTKHKPLEFSVSADGDVDIDASTHEWTNYFKAGLRGAMELLREKSSSFSPLNMNVLVDGNVPAGGGLSSSAAFVCASALAVLRAHGEREVSKKELVELAIVSERAVGVNSGGMDQAASVFSIRGDALSVSFSPQLHAEVIAFPKLEPEITFMIAQSFVAADKHVTAPKCYNLRVVECSLAAEFIASKLDLKLEIDSSPLGQSLRGLQNTFFASSDSHSNFSLSEIQSLEKMISLVETHLPSTSGYTREEIASTLKISVSDLESRYMTKFPVQATHFQLRYRALHVFDEAIRVSKFKTLLQSPPAQDSLLPRLGDLMNKTQTSCSEVYDCSCPELDQLCDIARQAGAYGSRLTGAGWGGCTVHLVPLEKVDAIRNAWENEYYRKEWPDISKERLAEAIVVSEPGMGAMIVDMS